ncbi:MAG: beta-galactosidase [Planctomycetes bacterium]|nr:beta-galactosidase [Planctomycetota bacterium]
MITLPFLLVSWLALSVPPTAPLVGDVPDQVIALNTSTSTLYFTIGDAETSFSALVVTATSSNPALVPNAAANLALGGANAQRTLVVTPANGAAGSATITLTVTDAQALTATSAFTLTVTQPNTPPTITGPNGPQIVRPGEAPPAVSFTVGDVETAASALTVVATSSNTALVPNANLTLGGSGSNRTVQATPVAGVRGSSVLRLRVSDASGAIAQTEVVFAVFDPASTNAAIRQPSGLYVLDSDQGTLVNGVSMRDANLRALPFVDGYVLRTAWATLEPTDGVFDFTIVDNLIGALPAGQSLSLIVGSGTLPAWLTSLPGITTWTGGTPPVTAPIPWDPIAQERHRLLLEALANHVVDGAPFRDHPRLAAFNAGIPGLKSGIRDPEVRIRDMPGYTRANLETAVLTHLAHVSDAFPTTPVHIGFWTFVDGQDATHGGLTPWEELRQAILANFDGVARPRIGFWMENLAANRPGAEVDPWTGLPNTSFSAPLFLSQDAAYVGYQMLGSWARPFNSAHVDNDLNGSPEDGMEYGFDAFQCRYFEVYVADVDFANYAPELQRWHDLLLALPASPGNATGGAFCTGDGASAACPCGNAGSAGHGCANSAFAAGAQLGGAGAARVLGDTAVLTALNLTGSTCVFFQGDAQAPPLAVDDGLGCVTGSVVRLGTKPIASSASSFPGAGDPAISVRGAIPATGGTRYYQCFYRNAVATFCPPATSNRTNGLVVTWVP